MNQSSINPNASQGYLSPTPGPSRRRETQLLEEATATEQSSWNKRKAAQAAEPNNKKSKPSLEKKAAFCAVPNDEAPEKPSDKDTEKQSNEKAPKKQSHEKALNKQSDEKAPNKQSDKKAPNKQSDEKAPNKQSDEKAPKKQSDEKAPEPRAEII